MPDTIVNPDLIYQDAGIHPNTYWHRQLKHYEKCVIRGIMYLDDRYDKKSWRTKMNDEIRSGNFSMQNWNYNPLSIVLGKGKFDAILEAGPYETYDDNVVWAERHGFKSIIEGSAREPSEHDRLLITMWKYYINFAPAMLKWRAPETRQIKVSRDEFINAVTARGNWLTVTRQGPVTYYDYIPPGKTYARILARRVVNNNPTIDTVYYLYF